jgi:hypothetical protein
MKTPTTFTRSVSVPKRDGATGEVMLDADKKPVVGESLGTFTFKCPTLREEIMISTRFAELTGGQKIDNMSVRALDIATILAELPIVVSTVPDKWVWADLEGDDDFYRLVAIWNAYQDGRSEIAGTKPRSETQEPASTTTAALRAS